MRVNELRIMARIFREAEPAPPLVSHRVIGEVLEAVAKGTVRDRVLRFGGIEDRARVLDGIAAG